MKREVGATTVLAALLMLVGAILLDTQWPTQAGDTLALAPPFYLVAEVGLYLVLLVVLDRGLNAAGYALGVFGALGTRLAVGFAAAGLDYLRAGGPYDAQLYPAIFSPARVAIAMAAAAAILILLRDLLPQRPLPARAVPRRRAQSSDQTTAASKAAKVAFGIVSEARDATEELDTERPSEIIFLDDSLPSRQPQPAPEPHFQGEIELPLAVLLRDAPQELRPADEQADALVQIPLAAIGPQLEEGRVVVTAGELVEWAPRGAVEASGLDPQAEISLPLDAIVPALPPGTLELGPPSPPAWYRGELTESEEAALFCAG